MPVKLAPGVAVDHDFREFRVCRVYADVPNVMAKPKMVMAMVMHMMDVVMVVMVNMAVSRFSR